jgi:hypothetical protein
MSLLATIRGKTNMQLTLKQLLLAASIAASAQLAQAATINFDESSATNNNSPYAATLFGATFGATNAGTWAAPATAIRVTGM